MKQIVNKKVTEMSNIQKGQRAGTINEALKSNSVSNSISLSPSTSYLK